ncbi:CRP-like cAMP-binding protein [Pseudochelatococcus lubricantis]|uniref:CRP-like cAMP-binding protein n=1 Tax=Pseudochelatococcus lubricantis TaxID=1538102 RepID=A0ABX0UUJ3_9HYPH|nr:Crp/Fnr family transcriptional regulator [Pseudochelatococcus lubricantis]NIJ56633.1 CRP-like cAMP-binding protein [Pseudochelatococcus lubricantis]
MTLETEVQVLRRVPMFRGLDKGRLKLLAFTSERVSFPGGQILFNRGDTSDAAYVILDGRADALLDTPAGAFKVAEFGAHDIVGEMGVLADTPRTATVRAATDLLVLRIDKQVFLELLNQFPQISIAVMRELAHRLERTTIRLAETAPADGASPSHD